MTRTSSLFEWRRALLAKDSGLKSGTRYVLLVLSMHMDRDGGSCFPSIDTLANETALSPKVAGEHLAAGEAAGWFYRWKSATGKGWARYNYQAVIPESRPVETTGPNEHGPVVFADGPVDSSNMVLKKLRTRTSSNSPNYNSNKYPSERREHLEDASAFGNVVPVIPAETPITDPDKESLQDKDLKAGSFWLRMVKQLSAHFGEGAKGAVDGLIRQHGRACVQQAFKACQPIDTFERIEELTRRCKA